MDIESDRAILHLEAALGYLDRAIARCSDAPRDEHAAVHDRSVCGFMAEEAARRIRWALGIFEIRSVGPNGLDANGQDPFEEPAVATRLD